MCDPFCGGGSIPLEAQRLGLRAYGSDLNPVAVLIAKATCEIPPKFTGRPPVNPERDRLATWRRCPRSRRRHPLLRPLDARRGTRANRPSLPQRPHHRGGGNGEREDLKPYVGKELTVIAWLWARTVASPDPMMRGAHVPLASSFVLSSKKGKEAIIVQPCSAPR